jgi:hypothetical protein
MRVSALAVGHPDEIIRWRTSEAGKLLAARSCHLHVAPSWVAYDIEIEADHPDVTMLPESMAIASRQHPSLNLLVDYGKDGHGEWTLFAWRDGSFTDIFKGKL